MKYTFWIITFLLTVIGIPVYSQDNSAQPTEGGTLIEFETKSHDFGTVNEGGAITYEFKFINKGTEPLIISNVRASCGCTTPFWTKDPIAPGQKGSITAQYNTINRPGPFNKTLTVTANTNPAMTILTITGNVLAKVKTPEELYPKKVGNIRLFSDHIYLGKVSTKEPVVKEVVLYNGGANPITFSTHELPAYMEVTFQPQTVSPKEKATLRISYNGLKRNELGPVEDKLVILTNEQSENKILLNVSADINEYYPPVSPEEAANVPKLAMDKSIVDFGMVKPNSTVSQEVEIKNPGKQDLELKKIRSGAAYISVKPEKGTVKAGQSLKLKITYKVTDKTGFDTQYVWIHSNDPERPTQNFTIKANVIAQ